MGLLDDAIREHLELKRRRGGDPGEIERAERDALAPARRQPEPIGDEPELADEGPYAAAHEHGDEGYYAEEEHGEEWFEEPREPSLSEPVSYEDTPDPHALRSAPSQPAFSEPAPAPAALPPQPAEAEEPHVAEPVGEVPTPHPATPVRVPDAEAHDEQETIEYQVELDVEDERHVDEMLEETPEFLQDTPDHDRLWFEQRPPRDFDFEG